MPRLAVVSLHTSPTASLGHSANGGLNVYVREVCRQLGLRGIATDVFTRRTPAIPAGFTEPLAPLSRVVYLDAGDPDLDKYDLAEQVEPFADRIEAYSADQQLAYDLLYSHYWLSGAVACTLRGRLRLPWVHTAHTLGFVKNARLADGAQPEPELRLLLEAEISRSADLLVMSTEAERAAVVRTFGVRFDRTLVAPPGVDGTVFHAVPRELALEEIGHAGSRVVLFIGRLERLKGAEIALRAFAAASASHPDARLVVVGGDSRHDGESERERLGAIAAELDISRRTSFAGSVDHHRLSLYYSAAEACLMPSYSESFGLVGLEAQACGCPVIAARAAGVAEVVRDGVTGYLVEANLPESYAERLARLLEQPQKAAEMGGRASILARGFSWSRTADRLLRGIGSLDSPRHAGVQASRLQE